MRKVLYLLLPLLLLACVGQKDDPEDWDPEPEGPEMPAAGAENGSHFFRRALALEFTATWCQYCPNMADALEAAKRQHPDRFVEIAVHYADELAALESDGIVEQLNVLAYPTMIFDWNESTRFTQQDPLRIIDYMDQILERQEEASGIAVVSEVNNGVVTVSVSMTAASAGNYSLVAAFVEDDIRVTQTGAGANYPCNAVLRGFLSPGKEGKPTGTLKEGESFTAVFSAHVPEREDKTRVVAYILQNGNAVNVAACDVNGKSDYTYEKDS